MSAEVSGAPPTFHGWGTGMRADHSSRVEIAVIVCGYGGFSAGVCWSWGRIRAEALSHYSSIFSSHSFHLFCLSAQYLRHRFACFLVDESLSTTLASMTPETKLRYEFAPYLPY